MNKPALTLSLLLLSLLTTFAYAKTVAGYEFGKYPAKVYTGKKAPLKLTKSDDWWFFRTRIRDIHHDGTVGFAGKYMVGIWGCGAGCVMGAMVDKSTGKVYGLPIGENTPYDLGCSHEFDSPLENERVVFFPNSRLFVTRDCENEQIGNSNQYLEKYTFNMYLWDEKTKKFKLTKKVHKTQTAIRDW